MRRIAIIGAGISGLIAAHGLRRAGYEVTIYSDRSAEAWRSGRPTGTAARFAPALAYEAELGLDHWAEEAPKIVGARLIYCPRPGNQLATLTGRQAAPGLAIDVRLQSHRWLLDLEALGGRVVIESVSVPRLDAIAAEHDLTIVAAGKGELADLFERDDERSVYRGPRRSVAMVVVHGPSLERDDTPFVAVRNNIVEGVGEAVWIPYFHRDVGPCWNLIFEAQIGGPMDTFLGAKTGAEALTEARRVIDAFVPWDRGWAREMELADERGWLAGQITPTVRRPVGRLPSGRIVGCLGDTAVLFDPLAAQGANNGTKMARHLVAQVIERGDRPFDAAWMTSTFDTFWARHGRPAYALTNLMLEPMTAEGRLLLLAQYGSDGVQEGGRQALADLFAAGFGDPALLLDALTDPAVARRVIRETTGRWWPGAVARGALGVARRQLRQALGRAPRHPGAPPSR
ncbi:MAG: styrene monooxygenase/indole monooxygenase family protein [Nannocystaceae bacterium]